MDDVIPCNMWVFYPSASEAEVPEYKKWCMENLQYVPYIDSNIMIFKSVDDVVFFRLTYANSR